MNDSASPLPGTPDLLTPSVVWRGKVLDYRVLLRTGQISGDACQAGRGAFHPAGFRLERQRLIDSGRKVSGNDRRDRFDRPTPACRPWLHEGGSSGNRPEDALAQTPRTTTEEICA